MTVQSRPTFRVVLPLPHTCATEGCENDPGFALHCERCIEEVVALQEWEVRRHIRSRRLRRMAREALRPGSLLRYVGLALCWLAFLLLVAAAVLITEDQALRWEAGIERPPVPREGR